MKKTAALVLALLAAAPAGAVPDLPGFSAGVFQSFGTDKYRGTDVYAAASLGDFSVAPELRRYEETGLNGPRLAASLRLGWDGRWIGTGLSGGFLPRKAGYDASFLGADVAFTVSPMGEGKIRRVGGPSRGGAPVGKGLARVDFGGGALVTQHREAGTVARASSKLTQTELNAFVGASVVGVLASARLAKYAYNADMLNNALNLPSPLWSPLAGHLRYANGFADTSLNLGVELPFFPLVTPFLGATYTKYKELSVAAGGRPGDTKAYTAGLRVGLEMLALEAQFQHVAQAGPAKERNYAGLGAQLRL
ncbi:MAG: hypothetical protein FD126_267 [Elusimicrobia bacterium]|nr:MAG: hypothetical protein FD126_267 [Elusimicrobiota bacterium]